MYALHQLARYTAYPKEESLECMNQLLGYLKNTPAVKRIFYKSRDNETNQLVAVTDASFATSTRGRSVGGSFTYWNQSLINATSITQRSTATSAPEAELYEVLSSTKGLMSVRGISRDFAAKTTQLAILTDSLSTVGTLHNPTSPRYSYLSIVINFIRVQVEAGILKVVHLPRDQNFADVLTKQPTVREFQDQIEKATSPFIWKHKRQGNGVRVNANHLIESR